MTYIDIFNGDADGICALVQLRNAEPRESRLVTGVKRDIELVLQAGIAAGDVVTVLDISFDKNREGVVTALDGGAEFFYVDHHFAGDIPPHERLHTIINTDANVCTSLLVNGHLKGRFVEWAVVGAFGDNLNASVEILARPLGLSEARLRQLENLGVYLNYNGYGAALADLHFHPADLYQAASRFASPFDFMAEDKAVFGQLEQGYQADMAAAAALSPHYADSVAAVFLLPEEPWARRVSGVYSNDLANANPDRAHAVLARNNKGSYVVSVRAPLHNKRGADEICRQFSTGGGRAAAAGINELMEADIPRFVDTLTAYYR